MRGLIGGVATISLIKRAVMKHPSALELAQLLQAFPKLTCSAFDFTSPCETQYNCIAWAAGDDKQWWEPAPNRFWPAGAPFNFTIAAYLSAFATCGYSTCSNGNLEDSVEKVALFAKNGLPTHASRQLPNGEWTSKLGKAWDITHSTYSLEGPAYGTVVAFLCRPRKAVSSQ